jgi:predicted phage terminase large subunit-like protein
MTDVPQIADPHALIEVLMRRDFASFLTRAFPWINGGADLTPNWHLDAVAHQLDRIRDGSCKRLLVTMPPRNLKSIMISVAWVAWRLGHDPSLNFVCVSYSNELSAKHARDCRAIMQAHWYRALFPRTIIAASRSAVHDFETTAGCGRLATSIGGTLTGRGGDIIIIDDPIKPDDAMSDSVRTNVNEWFQTTLASRLNDKTRGAIITVMQRLHQHDLAGTLLETGEWDELCLPAIAMEDAVIPMTRGRKYVRRTGEVLHPAREPLATLERIKATIGSVIFAAQYQQQPVPSEGNMIHVDWPKTYEGFIDKASPGGQIVQSWDTASKDGVLNDWSVCITALVRRKEVYIVDVWRKRVAFPDLKKAAIWLARDHKANVVLIEDQASGTQLIQTLRNEQPTGVPHPIARKPEADKKTRLSGVSAMIEAGQLLLPHEAPWLGTFMSELLGFPSTRYDDQVDALSQLLSWVDRQQRDGTPPVGPILFFVDDCGGIRTVGDADDIFGCEDESNVSDIAGEWF